MILLNVKCHEVEYAKEAEGRTICLVPDDANTFDMLAVKALTNSSS